MKTTYRYLLITIFTFTLIACKDTNPDITQIMVKSDRSGVLLNTNDVEVLAKIKPIFYEKQESPDAAPDFFYFVDITIAGEKVRWQYSDEGFIRNYDEGFSMIYQLRDVAEFNKIAKIK